MPNLQPFAMLNQISASLGTQAVVQEVARQGVNATAQAIQQQAQGIALDTAARDTATKGEKPKDNPGAPQKPRQ